MWGVNGTITRPCKSNASIPQKATETSGTNSKGPNTSNKPGRPSRVAPSEVPVETLEHRKPGRPPRVSPIKMSTVTQEGMNHMAPTIPIATHNMSTQVEDEPFLCYCILFYW